MAAPAGEVLNLPDDLLAAILILLPTLADIGRACASCAAFRRVITSPTFLRRLHALHPPALLGFRTFFGSFHPLDPPHPSAAAARALAGAADFRFSFLPNPGFWVVRDVRGGRFLVDCGDGGDGIFTTLAVCDPLFRRYVLLPPIPEDLAAATIQQPITTGFPVSRHASSKRKSDVLLAPCSEEDEAAAIAAGQPQPFRVIWIAQCASKPAAFVFSSVSSQWRAISSPSWCDLDPDMPALSHYRCLFPGGYAYGCFYWCLSNLLRVFKLLVLDMSTMEFSSIHALSEPCWSFNEFAMVELGESRRGMFLVAQRNGSGLLQLFCANGRSHGEDASQWVLTKEVPLPWFDGHRRRIIGDADGTLLLQGEQEHVSSLGKFSCIGFDFKTLQFQKVRGGLVGGEGDRALPAPYTGYPPSLASPAI